MNIGELGTAFNSHKHYLLATVINQISLGNSAGSKPQFLVASSSVLNAGI